MPRPILFVASLTMVASLAWFAGQAAEDKKDEKEGEQPGKKAAAEQLALAERAISLGTEGFRASRIRLSEAQVERWSLRRIDALKAGDASEKEIQKAREAHLELMKSLEKLAESLFKSAQAAEIDYLEARYARLEAERLLADHVEAENDSDDAKTGRAADKKKRQSKDSDR